MPKEMIRLQKYLSERGVASRRTAAALIEAGLVKVNGRLVTEPGARLDPDDCSITVRDEPIGPDVPATRTILLYKPRGYICSRASGQGHTVYELLGEEEQKLVPVGRLDKNSEGLLLLSNDGALVHRLTHPRYGHQKTYRVTVSGNVSARTLDLLRSRMNIDGYRIQPVDVTVQTRKETELDRTVLQFSMGEGRNRQIRKMCEQAGLKIHRLVRTRMGKLSIKGLHPGQYREVTTAAASEA